MIQKLFPKEENKTNKQKKSDNIQNKTILSE